MQPHLSTRRLHLRLHRLLALWALQPGRQPAADPLRPFLFGNTILMAIALLLVAGLRHIQATAAVGPRAAAMPALQGEAAIEHLKQDGSYESLRQAMAAIGYEARWQSQPQNKGVGAGYELKNAANNLLAYVTADGLQVGALGDQPRTWQMGLKLKGYGYGSKLLPVEAGEVKAAGNRIEIRRPALSEWYVNTAQGLEQGFELARPPAERVKGERPRLALEVSGDLQARMDAAGKGVVFSRAAEDVVLTYDKLSVVDAQGQAIEATMRVEEGRLLIEVEDAAAEYPLRIDPLLRQLTKLTAPDGAELDFFGDSVAISGDTAVVGAYQDDVGTNAYQGSAYVFTRSGASWVQQAKLTAADGEAADLFGYSVAISGDTVVVGADEDDVGANREQGSAYVFVRSGTAWSQQAKLVASDGATDDYFGNAVAVSGDTVIVGALADDVGAYNQGSAYVFTRSGTSWVQQAKLTASDGAAGDFFGYSAAISGDTAVVGAYQDDVGANANQGSAYVFTRSGTAWSQQQQLTAADGATSDLFGISVAISGDTAVVGAAYHDVGANTNQGSAYVFVRSGTAWSQQQQLTAADGATSDNFGYSVAISGDTAVVGAYQDDVGTNTDQGSAYVFTRSGTAWSQQQQLTAADGEAYDNFGNSAAISGDTVVVGAYYDVVGANRYQGSAYLFVGNWTEQSMLTASDGAASDIFGRSVAISGDTVVVGAPLDDVGANANQGSAYVFVRSGATWTHQQQLTAADGAASDNFGLSVAISGDTVVVGAYSDDVGANTDQGSAYVFVRLGTSWTQQQQLTASDGTISDYFGYAVAISGDTVIVGAYADDVGATVNQGSAYVFVRSGATWTHQQQLTAADGAFNDNLGWSVAISGDTVVVGARVDDVGANIDQGSAYVFARSGTTWSQQAKLVASDGADHDYFGYAVAISGDTLVVGAYQDNVGANIDQGSAYVFTRSGTAWSQQQQLTAADGALGDNFGNSVAISGDTVVVGAYSDDVGANTDQGSAYVFVRSGTSWNQQQQLTAADGALGDNFGYAVAISGDTAVVGAAYDDVGVNNSQGSAYVFVFGFNTAPVIVASTGLSRQQGSPATFSTIATVDDAQDAIGYLTVSVFWAPAGISVTNVTNINGTIIAMVGASCTATPGNNMVVLQVQDSDGAVGTAQMVINVTANTAPSLGIYPNTAVAVLGATTVTPNATPADNGAIVSFSAASPTFTGTLSTNLASGVVTITNARPGGTHYVTVTAFDNCGVTTTSGFTLRVNCQAITVNPATLPAATAGTAYSQTFTQTGGNGTVTFALAGLLPAGLSFNAATATLSGTPTEVGSFPITVTATDENNCSGSRNYTLTVNAPLLVWNGATSSDWQTAANWSPNAVPTAYHDVLIPTAGVVNQPVVSAASSAIHAMTIQAGRLLTINASRELATTADLTTSGTISGAGKLTFGGATFTQNGTVSVAAVEFSPGNHALTGGGAFAAGIATILNGASVTLLSNHQMSVVVINSGGSFDITGRTLTLTGAGTAMFVSGYCTTTASTVVYAGAVAQVIAAYMDYYNLTINNPAGVSLADDMTVNGQLNLLTDLTTGAFTVIMPATATSAGSADVIGNVRRMGFVTGGVALSFGNPLNSIHIDAGSAPTEITVNLVKSAPAGFAKTVPRTYTITPAGGSGYSATLRLRYKEAEAAGLNESTFELWRYNGATWQSPPASATRDVTANWVEESGVTEFSPWTIAGPAGPTAVELIGFAATGYDDGVLLEWQTGYEVNNLGFNLYSDSDGHRARINQELIAGSALTVGSARLESGRNYVWHDQATGAAGKQYWLEDVDLDGTSTWHGPFAVKPIGGKLPARSAATLLPALSRNEGLLRQGRSLSPWPPATPAQQAQQAIIAANRAVKLFIREEGWYRVTSEQLSAAGFAAGDPRYLQLYAEGIEQPILVRAAAMEGTEADAGYAVEFYATGLDTPATDTRVYWLVAGRQPGKRIAVRQSEATGSGARSFDYTIERRERSLYFAALRNGEAENFFGRVITGQAIDLAMNVSYLDHEAGRAAELELALQGVTELAGAADHNVEVRLNGSVVGQMIFDGRQHAIKKFSLSATLLREGDNTISLSATNGPFDISLVDYARLTYRRLYVADRDALRCSASLNQGSAQTIAGFSAASVRVIDITDRTSVEEIAGRVETMKGGGYAVTVDLGGVNRELLAFTDAQVKRPLAIGLDRPSSLMQPQAGADLLIISRREFIEALGPLVALRQTQGLTAMIIDLEDIYDEFNFGEKSAAAVKSFLQYSRSSWQRKPAYLLLAGAASFDPKDYLGYGETDLVPTKLVDTSYMETASDDWLADFDSDGIGDMAIGRLPVRSAAEAARVVSKLVSYEQVSGAGAALLVADEGFEQESAGLAPLLAGMRVSEIRRGELGDERAREQLLAALNRGQMLVNYIGHGSADGWRGRLLQTADAEGLTNGEHLSVFVMMTCLNGYYDAGAVSLGEALVTAAPGGASAVWASTGMTLPGEQAKVNVELYRQMFGRASIKGAPVRLGEAVQRAKATTADMDVRRTWVLLGDPSMRM